MTPRKNYLRSVKTLDGYSVGWTETNFDEGIDGKVTQTIRLMRLDKECPEDSVENLLLDIGLFECPEDHLLINNYTISDWELSSISVVYEYLDCRITSVPHRD